MSAVGDSEAKRFFTVEEAEKLIPRLEVVMGRLMDCRSEAGQLRASLQEEQRRVAVSGGFQLDREAWRERRERLEALAREMEARVEEILGLGAVPKDLEPGLVDFPFLLGDEEVNLCWRFGEKRIRFWHGLDEGFAGRKPLPDELVEGE